MVLVSLTNEESLNLWAMEDSTDWEEGREGSKVMRPGKTHV